MEGEIGHGLKWSAISVLAVRLLGAVRSLAIARVLGPEPVGSFAAAFAFVALASLVAEFGLQSYLIQRGPNARDDAFAVGQVAVVTGAVSAIALLVLARPIAAFYDDGEVASLVAVMAVSVVIASLSIVPNALLRVAFRFDAVGRAAVVAEICACVVGVGAAVAGAGVWSLVAATLTGQFVLFVGLLLARPTWTRSPKAGRADTRRRSIRFGASLAAGSAVWTLALQGDNVIVGRVLGASALGLYAFAYNYGILPGGLIGSTVTDVALAGFSNEPVAARRAELFRQFVRVGAAAASPLVAVALVSAPAGIRLVLGDEWVGAIRPLQILLLVGWVRGILPTEALLRSAGRVGVELRVGLIAAPATIAAAYVGAQSGLTEVALAVGAVLIAASIAATWIAGRTTELRLSAVASAAAPSVALAAICVTPVVVNEMIGGAPDAVTLFVLAPLCLLVNVLATRRWLPEEWRSVTGIASARRSATSV